MKNILPRKIGLKDLKAPQKKSIDTFEVAFAAQYTASILFYKRYGFEICGKQPFLLGEGLQIDLEMKLSSQ
ncbi:MAG: hypothetical protein OIF50_09595 [Flavobacteriaceae bacterium]|nr:hypothetical protein [Flavobacteriaceae bacterium]